MILRRDFGVFDPERVEWGSLLAEESPLCFEGSSLFPEGISLFVDESLQ